MIQRLRPLSWMILGLVMPLGANGAELARIELPQQAEVIGTYDEQTQVLTCVTPHGHISGHLAPTAITGIKPLSASEAADGLALMQKQVDEMITEAKEHEAAKPPPAAPAAVATPPMNAFGPGQQPGGGPQGPPRVRRNRAMRSWQNNPGNPNQPMGGWGGGQGQGGGNQMFIPQTSPAPAPSP